MDIMEFGEPAFWLALVQIIWINILLSGDNAVVIAMACRGLPDHLRQKGIWLGAGAAIGLRILFTGIVVWLLGIPYLKIVGALALIWIAVQLLAPESDEEHKTAATDNLWKAVGTIAVADIVMSLDNVIAIAGAAQGDWLLIIVGLLISIPLIIAGSTLVMAMLTRFPILVWAGAALLGWIAGEMFLSDPAIVARYGEEALHGWHYPAAAIGAVVVLALGALYRRYKTPAAGPEVVH